MRKYTTNDTTQESIVPVTVNLPQDTLDALKKLANEQDITATAALQKAVATELFIRTEAINKHAKILIQDIDGGTKEIIFS